jgi:hypothetical protein
MNDAITMLIRLNLTTEPIILYYIVNGLVEIDSGSVFNYIFNFRKHTYQFILFPRKSILDYNETYLDEIRHEIQSDYKVIKRKEVIKKLLDDK